MNRIRLVADDLTGALDSAVQFTESVPGLPVLLDWRQGVSVSAADAGAAICTESRDLDAVAAAERATQAAPFLAAADLAFLKIDSLLRGNWAVELTRLLALLPERMCIFAPAFPAEQRFTREGRQFAPGPEGKVAQLTPVPQDALAGLSVRAHVVASGCAPRADRGGVAICDAESDADLAAIVAAARAIGEPVLWCGSAGLARALSGCAPPQISLRGDWPLIVIGSQHPRTLSQIAALPLGAAHRIAIGTDAAESAARITRSLAQKPCIVTIDVPDGTTRSAAAARIAERFAAVLPRLAPPASLAVIGGETLSAVCRAIGAKALQLEGEWRAGVPGSRITGGIWHGVPLISRSGAFGSAGFFNELFEESRGCSQTRA